MSYWCINLLLCICFISPQTRVDSLNLIKFMCDANIAYRDINWLIKRGYPPIEKLSVVKISCNSGNNVKFTYLVRHSQIWINLINLSGLILTMVSIYSIYILCITSAFFLCVSFVSYNDLSQLINRGFMISRGDWC